MPAIKRNVSKAADTTGFEPYDGPTPPKGLYRAIIKSGKITKAKTGRDGIIIVAELEAVKGSNHAQYDGYPAFTRIYFGDEGEEILQTREKQFYKSLGLNPEKGDVSIVCDALEDGGRIKTIGGKKIEGKEVLVDLREETYEGEPRTSSDGIMPVKKVTTKDEPVEDDEVEDDEDDLVEAETEDEETEDDEEDPEVAERTEELQALTLPALRKIAKALDLDPSGLKKAEIVESILDAEFPVEGDEEAEDEDDEDEESDDDLEDAEEEDEEDDEDEDEESTLRAELADLDRAALKKRISASEDGAKFKKSETDEDLRDRVVALEIGDTEPPF